MEASDRAGYLLITQLNVIKKRRECQTPESSQGETLLMRYLWLHIGTLHYGPYPGAYLARRDSSIAAKHSDIKTVK